MCTPPFVQIKNEYIIKCINTVSLYLYSKRADCSIKSIYVYQSVCTFKDLIAVGVVVVVIVW